MWETYWHSANFTQVHEKNISSCRVQGVERVNPPLREGDSRRKLNREAYWIFLLVICMPNSMNQRQDFILHYTKLTALYA